jgi:hypothetical protein
MVSLFLIVPLFPETNTPPNRRLRPSERSEESAKNLGDVDARLLLRHA